MILQALNQYYNRLVENGELERPGWELVNVSYALQIDDDGELVRVLPQEAEVVRGKKTVKLPKQINVPAQVKRSVDISPNFLCDNSTYIIGIDAKGKPDRSIKCFEASREKHCEWLKNSISKPAKAVTNFFIKWDPKKAAENPVLEPYLESIQKGGNLIFDYNGEFVQNCPEIQNIWNERYQDHSDNDEMICLVTGKKASIARIHPSIKGIYGGQTSGVSLVSFNKPSFESYGFDGKQGLNAPVSEEAAFGYTSALKFMVNNAGKNWRIGDTTTVFWSESGRDEYSDYADFMLGGDVPSGETDDTIYQRLKDLSLGRKVIFDQGSLMPDEKFYILGLEPNAARLSVKYFISNEFGVFVKNVLEHHERLEIVRPNYDQKQYLSFWNIFNETVNPKSKDKSPSPVLVAAVVRAVLQGLPYPALLYDQIQLRIRADRIVNRTRASIIKAYLIRNIANNNKKLKEVVTVELNENTTYQPYLFGRLFAVLEALQSAANPGINTTIRDRYFNSACSTPAVVFPQLLKLAQAHLKKVNQGTAVYYNKLICTIMEGIHSEFPARLSLYDQGVFQLGYYHQFQKRFEKKED
ncbi:MAG: type I-C CRISPR-associated protein Cas8c/Csd1 [Clostridia bacterium]|nr:type I-C CRISPR-associated protein Cas8c/Csd1 [Clostridia bacterium]